MVTQMTQGCTLPPEMMKEIVARTDGNPLFVEELTKAVLESGTLVDSRMAISSTVLRRP